MASLRSVSTILRSQARPSTFTTRQQISITSINASRSYHNTSPLRLPYKDDQDRQSLKPKSTEGTKSGTDNETAQTDAAFDGSKTSPEEAHASAEKESDGNALDTSGANQSKSKPLGGEGGGEMKSTTKGQNDKPSGHGSPQKKGKLPGA
ncbi:hypothetical protein N0V93_002883 [Gnomoniopsis smithogilvyi]|uniref:Uncharacterized protein n=1 Tax=Gnomoniopsis smithogilvyi TaxID=1191159 RepID=A0A9W8YXI2_9PEZI|nr:hypothetical protein N0V93_002883 [Gnomoniopsis smithogilvyi]